MLPVWVWVVAALLAVAIAASMSGSDSATNSADPDDTPAPSADQIVDPPGSSSAPQPTRPEESVDSAPDGSSELSTDADPASSSAGTAAEPWALGDPDAVFEYSSFFGDRWSGSITGLGAGERGIISDDPGDCMAVVGEMVATEVDGFMALIFGTPDVRLIVDGRLLDSAFGVCDTTDLERSGYGWLLEAAVTEGSSYAFYNEFLVPPGGTIDAVVVGDASSNDAFFYEPVVTGSIPPITMRVVAPTPTGLLPVGDPNRSTFTYDDGTGDVWNGYLAGLAEVELSSFTDETGRCLVVVGTLVPTETGGAISNFGSTPDISLLVDGRSIASDLFSCSTSTVEDAGYDWILDAEVTAGTVFAFHEASSFRRAAKSRRSSSARHHSATWCCSSRPCSIASPTPDRNRSTRTGRLDVSRAPGVTAALASSNGFTGRSVMAGKQAPRRHTIPAPWRSSACRRVRGHSTNAKRSDAGRSHAGSVAVRPGG